MTFEEVLAQIIEVLQREKRISYRALKRRFALDDAYLDDLKEELIYAKHLALDEDSRVLVWSGDAEAPLLSAPPTSPPVPPTAERRQLTVLFCDLVDSTALAGRLDPEDLREVVQAYQQTCAQVIQRYEGHIAQYLGDGLLVYFGYPRAHEDDAQRAVQTGLGIVEAMGTLNTGLEQAHGLRLAVRVGIHTGLVVIGEMGGAGRQEQLALGETPNIAARLQGLAQPDTVVISDRTARLVEGYFTCQPLGAQELKGLAQPLQVYRVLHASAAQTRLDVAAPEVGHAYTRAYALCQQVGETPELVPVLFGLWRFYTARPQFQMARELGETLLRLAQHTHDPALAVIAHHALGTACFFLGALPAARQHLEAGIARYTPDQRCAPVFRIGQDPGVGCQLHAARTLWLLGYPEQALARLHEALALAHELSHPSSLAFARWVAASIHQFRRDVPAVHAQAEAAIVLSTAQEFPLWVAAGTSFRGWALAMRGQGEAGLAQVRQGIAAWRATGAALLVPYFCTLLAEVSAHLGHAEDGLQALAEAHTLVEQHEERWWEAEVYRLRGVLLLQQPGTSQAEAETWLQRALDVARHQQAKSLELRAAMSLARLWQRQGKHTEAYELLAPVYNWFTEGFDTADLQEAKALLDVLSEERTGLV